MAQTSISNLFIGTSLLDGVFVETIERCSIDDVECYLFVAISHNSVAVGTCFISVHPYLRAEVYATLRIIGKLLFRIVIAGQRGIAGIPIRYQRITILYAAMVPQLTTQRQPHLNTLGIVCRDAHYNS